MLNLFTVQEIFLQLAPIDNFKEKLQLAPDHSSGFGPVLFKQAIPEGFFFSIKPLDLVFEET